MVMQDENHANVAQSAGLAGLFGEASDMSDAGAYAEWTKGINSAQMLNLETPDSFIESGPLTQEEQRWVDRMCGLGREQWDAPCNNRLEYLLHQAAERAQLVQMKEQGEDYRAPLPTADDLITKDTYEILRMLIPNAGRETAEELDKRITAIDADMTRVVNEIRRDMAAGHFRDYYRAKSLYVRPDPEKLLNGEKALTAPFFRKEAMLLVISKMQGTRQRHTQSLWARMLGDRSLKDNIDLQARRRKPRRQAQDDDEE